MAKRMNKVDWPISREQVELIPAYIWNCPICARELGARCIIHPEDDRNCGRGYVCHAPEFVGCPDCQIDFPTRMFPVPPGKEGPIERLSTGGAL